MKKSLFTLFFIGLFICEISGQYLPKTPFKKWNFTNVTPNFYHVFRDSSSISQLSDGYNCLNYFLDKTYLVESNFMYLLFIYRYNGDVEGGYLTKMDLETGKEVWHTTYNLQNNDRQERPTQLEFDQNGNLEVTGYRRLSGPTPNVFPSFEIVDKNCTISKRVYDKSTGSLLSFDAPIINYSISAGINGKGDGASLLRKKKDGDYFYIRNLLISGQNTNIAFYNINGNDFSVKRIDTLLGHPFISKYSVLFHSPLKEINDNNCYVTKFDTLDNNLTLFKTNLYGDLLDSIHLLSDSLGFYKSVLEIGDNYIMQTENIDYIENRFITNYYIYNKKGELLNFISEKNYERPNFITLPIYNKEKNKLKLITTTPPLVEKNSKARMAFYEDGLDYNEPKLLSEIPYNDSLKFVIPMFIYTYKDNILILLKEYAAYLHNGFYQQDFNAQALSLVSFKAKDLGLSTATNDISKIEPLTVYPNPSSGKVFLEKGYDINQISILDIKGSAVKTMISDTNILEVDISDLPQGSYIIKALEKHGKILVSKIVKF